MFQVFKVIFIIESGCIQMTDYRFMKGFVTVLDIRMKVPIWLDYLKDEWIFLVIVFIL